LIDLCRAALSVRHRETDPITYANPREVYLIPLEDGFDVAVFGMLPERRLPIESFFGYVIAHNRIPLGYGGGWVFFDRCEIGINVFDTFRGGESALAFAQIMRVYRQLFGSTVFTVDPFQFGADNPEAIASGAFWFYYRLGFRPIETKLRDLAAREWEKLQRLPRNRTSRAILRRFAAGRIALSLDGDEHPDSAAPRLPAIGSAITEWIGRGCGGDREAAVRRAVQKVSRKLGPIGLEKLSDAQRRQCERMCLLAAILPDLADYSRKERQALLDLLRAKGGRLERMYALRLRDRDRLKRSLDKVVRDAISV